MGKFIVSYVGCMYLVYMNIVIKNKNRLKIKVRKSG